MSEEMSEADLIQIFARASAAPPGPWEPFIEGRDHYSEDDFIRTGGLDDQAPDIYVSLSNWDEKPSRPAPPTVLDFIAAARQDVPRLVEEVRRLHEVGESTRRQLSEIERLLDEGIGREGLEDLTLVERVADLIAGFNSWADFAITRLHEVHRLSGDECGFCAEYLDPQ